MSTLVAQIVAVCKLPLIASQSKISSYHTENNDSEGYPLSMASYSNERAVQFADSRREVNIDTILLARDSGIHIHSCPLSQSTNCH